MNNFSILEVAFKLIPNHSNDYGISTSIYRVDNYIYACSYDIDRGVAAFNGIIFFERITNYKNDL